MQSMACAIVQNSLGSRRPGLAPPQTMTQKLITQTRLRKQLQWLSVESEPDQQPAAESDASEQASDTER